MTSARVVAFALLIAAGSVGALRAQAPGPGKSATPGVAEELTLGLPNAPSYECVFELKELRSQVEKEGMAIRAGSHQRLARQELCRRVTAYSTAQIKWVKYAELNMSQCGIPEHVVNEMKAALSETADTQKKLCSENNPGYRWDPPLRPIEYNSLPRFSGR